MANKKNNNNNTTTTIIKFVVNGLTAVESIDIVKTELEDHEKSAFNVGMVVSYGTGVTIPTYTDNKGVEHGEATCEKPIKQADYIKLVGRSKQTISRWVKAVKLIIENGYFNDFASGLYPFSYDKIILIFDEKTKDAFNGKPLADLMLLSVDTLETIADKKKKEETTTEEEATSENTEEATSEAENQEEEVTSEETTTLVYNDKEYVVNKLAFEKWLAENGTMKK